MCVCAISIYMLEEAGINFEILEEYLLLTGEGSQTVATVTDSEFNLPLCLKLAGVNPLSRV